jgi:hypothetical protein
MRLIWNFREEGLHVFQVPFGTSGAVVNHWFWDHKADSWWEDQINSASKNPGAVYVIDGDTPDDRFLLLGGMDGFIRKWDETAFDDDGTAIDSNVLMGPFTQKGILRQLRFYKFTPILADDQDGCRFEMMANDSPVTVPAAQVTGLLQPGNNLSQFHKLRGSYLWIRLSNASVSERWAYEHATVYATSAGRKKISSG